MYDMNAMPNLLMHMQNAVPQIAYPTVDQFFVPPVDFQLFNDAQQFQLFNDAQYFQPVDYLPQFIPTPIMNFPDFMLTQPPMILDSIPNLRGIQMDLPTEYMGFVMEFDSIMRTLNFPVIQLKITKTQLKERLENMSADEFKKICIASENMVRFFGSEFSKKKTILEELKNCCKEIIVNVIAGVISGVIILALSPEQSNENVTNNYYITNNFPSSAKTEIISSKTAESGIETQLETKSTQLRVNTK